MVIREIRRMEKEEETSSRGAAASEAIRAIFSSTTSEKILEINSWSWEDCEAKRVMRKIKERIEKKKCRSIRFRIVCSILRNAVKHLSSFGFNCWKNAVKSCSSFMDT